MAYKAQIINGIWANESDYRDSPIGKLEKTSLVRTMNFPLQQGFDGDSQACLAVSIDYLPTFLTPEQRIVGAMSHSHSTAVGTPFGCMPTVHDVQNNIIVEASLFENLPESIKWDSHDFLVEFLPLGIESLELFDCNISIESLCNPDNLTNDLTEIGLHEVPFNISETFQLIYCFQRLEQSPSSHNLLPLNPNVLSQICLIQNLSIWRNNADSKMLGIDVDSKDILPMENLLFFGQIGDNLRIRSQSIGLANPSICNQGSKSLIVPILLDRNCNLLFWIKTKTDKEIGLHAESFAVSGTVEFDSQSFDFLSLISPSIPYEGTTDLNIERGVHFAS